MSGTWGLGLRGASIVAASTFLCSAGAGATQPSGAPSAAPGADLRRQLETLATNPTSVSALIDTGRAALTHGDAQAALGMFSRAQQLSPRDPRVQAGLATAHSRAGQPELALVMFAEAVRLGAPEAEIAAERGLAYDLTGQCARAQQDYVLSLRLREDAEVRRRLALSLAITGQRDAALRVLDGQIRSGDRAAFRARAFIYAVSGDAPGALAAARSTMLPGTAQAIAPFLQRLATLQPAQMAAAANLGRFPSERGVVQTAGTGEPAPYQGALAFAGTGPVVRSASPTGTSLASRLPVAPRTAGVTPRRRPGETGTLALATRRPVASRPARSTSTPSPLLAARPSGNQSARTAERQVVPAGQSAATFPTLAISSAVFLQPHPHEPLPRTAITTELAGGAVTGMSALPSTSVALPASGASGLAPTEPMAAPPASAASYTHTPGAPAQTATLVAALDPGTPPAPTTEVAAANLAAWNGAAAPAVTSHTPPAPGAALPSAPRPGFTPMFADVVANLATLAAEDERTATPPAAPAIPAAAPAPLVDRRPTPRLALTPAPRTITPALPTRTTRVLAAGTPVPRAPRSTTPAHPARNWVQIATAARASLPGELARLRRAAPVLLATRPGHTAPMGVSSRLLIGPFATPAEARVFVNRLTTEDIRAFAWASPAGQEVERLPAAR